MTDSDINTDYYYIVEQRASGMSILPFGFKTDEDASQAMKGFGKRKKKMKVIVGAKLSDIKADYLGK